MFNSRIARREFLRAAGVALAGIPPISRIPWRNDAMKRILVDDGLASLRGATGWINSPPLTAEQLQGRVVLIQFWTFTCINWLRTEPYTRAWYEAYRDSGLVVIGVHTPEFGFEGDLANVRRMTAELRVPHPVAVDTDYAIWRGFSNQYWPALYLLDGRGKIRHHHFGEGGFAESERMIQQLLKENGATVTRPIVPVEGAGIELAADWSHLDSAENYLGAERTSNFVATQGKDRGYSTPGSLRRNEWGLEGGWAVRPGSIALTQGGGRIIYRFHARDVHLVMGPPSGSVRFRVLLDGQPPENAHGGDIDPQGNGIATEQRLHQLIRQPGPIADRTITIEFLDPGVEAFSFTFG